MEDALISCAIDFALGGTIGFMSWFWGGKDGFIMVLLSLVIIDQLSGVAAGYVEHKLSSEEGFKGIVKKCMIFSFVGIAHLLDSYLMGNSDTIRTAVCMFYIGNEGISILENAKRLGVPFPAYFEERFLNMKKLNDKKEKGKLR